MHIYNYIDKAAELQAAAAAAAPAAAEAAQASEGDKCGQH